MRPDTDDLRDLELRLVDPAKNRFRIYGLTECRTLFGELCLRIVWGRIGNRRPRECTEVFEDRSALERASSTTAPATAACRSSRSRPHRIDRKTLPE